MAQDTDAESGVEFLDWMVELVENGGVAQVPSDDLESVPQGTQFSVAGTVDEDGYLYVIAVMDNQFAVLYPASGADAEKAGTSLRLPADGSRFTAPFTGQIYVVLADHVMTADDWAAEFPVRDPPPVVDRGPC
jgi:hypothetical protein